MLGDASQDVGQPSLRVDIVQFRGADQAVHRRGSLSAAVGTREQPDFLLRAILLSARSAALFDR